MCAVIEGGARDSATICKCTVRCGYVRRDAVCERSASLVHSYDMIEGEMSVGAEKLENELETRDTVALPHHSRTLLESPIFKLFIEQIYFNIFWPRRRR